MNDLSAPSFMTCSDARRDAPYPPDAPVIKASRPRISLSTGIVGWYTHPDDTGLKGDESSIPESSRRDNPVV